MRISNWEKFNENEFTRLATKYMGPMHKDFAFNGPTDNFDIKYITISFPDGAVINFDCRENHTKDIGTFKLSATRESSSKRIAQLYLNLYGDEIQFEDFKEYQMIRYYMNRTDLFDTTFDGYIYGQEKLGATDIKIHINTINTSELIPQYFVNRSNNLFQINTTAQFTLESAIKIVKDIPAWRNFFIDHKDETLQNFIDPLDKISIDTHDQVIPANVNYKGMNICGYLYLYGILHGFTDKKEDIKFILNRFNTPMSPEKIIGVLYEMI